MVGNRLVALPSGGRTTFGRGYRRLEGEDQWIRKESVDLNQQTCCEGEPYSCYNWCGGKIRSKVFHRFGILL